MKITDRIKNAYDSFKGKTQINDGILNLLNVNGQRRNPIAVENNIVNADATIPYSQLESVYLTSWVGKKTVEIPVEYMWKNGFIFTIKSMPSLQAKIMDEWKKRKLENHIKKAQMDCGIYGGDVMFIKNPWQNPQAKFDPTLLCQNPDDVKFVPVDLSYIAVTPYMDMISENYMRPKTISIAGLTADVSNTIVFNGIEVPARRRAAFRYIGMSTYQNIFQAMLSDDMVSQGIANMVYRNNRWYYGIEGLSDLVKQGNGKLLLQRLAALENTMSMYNAGVVDKNDTVTLISQSFSSLPDVDQRSMERLAAATNIPATVLLGKSPDGMNATGDSDLEIFYNYIESGQRKDIDKVKRVFEMLIYMYNDGEMVDYEFTFNKPNQISTIKQVDVDTKVINNVKGLQEIGLPEEDTKKYMVDKGLITSEQAENMTLETLEMIQGAEGNEEGFDGKKGDTDIKE